MDRGQSIPEEWLVVDRRVGRELRRMLENLPFGRGVLLLQRPKAADQRWLHRLANRRRLTVIFEEQGTAARVHDQTELTVALLRRAPLILVSPLYRTNSHPGWKPMPRMRAAALARLAGRRAIALGGMNERRYARLARLGFIGWAGISAFRT